MILKALLILMGGLSYMVAHAQESESLLGIWRYDGFFYEGNRYPNPNPELELEFTFYANGVSRLFWARKNESGFCECLASYRIAGNLLWQKVTWVNPDNLAECAQDQDMQLGRETQTSFSRPNDELWFRFELNGKPFDYILKFKSAADSTQARSAP